MRLVKVKLQNVFCFRDASLTVDRHVTSIIGENDTGKTNLLRCLHNIFGDNGSLDSLGEMKCQFGSGQPIVKMWFSFEDSETDRLRDLLKTGSKFESQQLQICCLPEEVILAWGKLYNQRKKLNASDFRAIQHGLLRTILFETIISPIRGSVQIPELIKEPESSEARLLQLGGLQQKDLGKLEVGHNDGYIALGNAGKQLTKQLKDQWTQNRSITIHLRPWDDPKGIPSIEFCIHDDLGATVPLLARGDGLRWFLSFFTELRSMVLPEEVMATLFLFDEPGIHLHPAAQSDLCRLFNEDIGAGANRQVLYTTHSPFMLDWSRPHQVRVLEKTALDIMIVDKPYHSEESLNFWEPFRRNIGLFLGDLGLLGTKCLLVEGVTDQILLSYLSREAKLQGQRHLDLGERRIIPFGDHRALGLLVGTCLANRREVAVLVDSDEAGKRAMEALRSAGYKKVPVLYLDEFSRDVFPKREIGIEDIFERAWYLAQVNEFYETFSWFSHRIDVSDVAEEQPVAKALEEYFLMSKWQDGKAHDFNKPSVAVQIASAEPTVEWGKMPVLFGALCERVESPLGILQIAICKDTSGTGLEHAKWAAVLSLSLGTNPGVNQLKIAPLKSGTELNDSLIEFPADSEKPSLIVWDVWEKKQMGKADIPCLRRGSARLLIAGDKSLSESDQIRVTVFLTNGTLRNYTCPLTAGHVRDPWERFARAYKCGDIVEGEVCELSHFTPAGFYVTFPEYGIQGFVHISEISDTGFIHDASDAVEIGKTIKAKILNIDPRERGLELSMIGIDQHS